MIAKKNRLNWDRVWKSFESWINNEKEKMGKCDKCGKWKGDFPGCDDQMKQIQVFVENEISRVVKE